MKALARTTYGSPSILKVKEIEIPIPDDNELLIRVYASTVNRTDCAILKGSPLIMRLITGLFKPKDLVPGTDFAGRIEAVGNKVNHYSVGQYVMGFDDSGLKSQAEYMVINQKKAIVKIPENLNFEQAAASMEGAHYAINVLNKIWLVKGQRVLIHGATGAIGSALLQFSVSAGALVTATCRAEHREMIKSLGAVKVIDYATEDFTLIDEKFDYVFDAVGKSTFGKCKKLLVAKGTYISSELGPWNQNPIFAITTPLTGGKKVIFPIPFDIKASLKFVCEQIELGKFTPLIDRTYPLEKASEAYEYSMSGQKVGNVILKIHSEISP